MSENKLKLRLMQNHNGGSSAGFYCPGCKELHAVNITPGSSPLWTYNNNPYSPTFHPSVLVQSGHYAKHYDGKGCWCTYYKEHPEEEDDGFRCVICHSFIRDGKIIFLNDCTHALAGQTVDLPDIDLPA